MNEDILNLYKSIGKTNEEKNQINLVSNCQPSTTATTLKQNDSLNNPDKFKGVSMKRAFSSGTSSEAMITENFLMLKRKREKCSKGLRHFSMKVCEKVKQKNVTTYNEVADELVNEYCSYATGGQFATSSMNSNSASAGSSIDFLSYDQKNVRRRVYDALNVLMAMNIISKEKKEIKWIGLPCNKKQECQDLEVEKKKKIEQVALKSEHLKDLILEHLAAKSLIERNKQSDFESINKNQLRALKLPFLVLSTDKKTQIDLTISNDRKEYLIQFDNTFEASTHLSVLKKLNLTIDTENFVDNTEEEPKSNKYSNMLPKMFEPYIKQLESTNKLEPNCLNLNLPNYGSLVNFEKELNNLNSKQNKSSSKLSNNDLGNENSIFEDDEEHLSNDENVDESDDQEDIDHRIYFNNQAEQISDEENSTDNDDEGSLPDSLSF